MCRSRDRPDGVPSAGRLAGQFEINNLICMSIETARSLWGASPSAGARHR
jgi:hypothetical protein